ncbi:hypothetical protein T4D_6167 [Trichinella pseudospiralis]|uniref:Uncharacterized protein n=1 Tax=Trichinella pseudospiralis TaxID=6337 RepID=A0A0V1FHS3_TRIPS|nr:hypothetical protein T4D_6167 [Trichinella pseudospiralis]
MNGRKIKKNLPPLCTAVKNRNALLWRTFAIYITGIKMRPKQEYSELKSCSQLKTSLVITLYTVRCFNIW